MPELLPTCAPLYPWLLDRCYRNLRVVRNPADPFSLRHDGQEIEIASRSTDPITDIDIMLIRRDGSPDDRWVSWCRSANYRVDLLHFATRAVVLDALASIGHARPWALGRCWSTLTDEQAARVTAAIVVAVGPDLTCPEHTAPVGILGPWRATNTHDDPGPRLGYRRSAYLGAEFSTVCDEPGLDLYGGWALVETSSRTRIAEGHEKGLVGRALSDASAQQRGLLLWEQITPPEKADAP